MSVGEISSPWEHPTSMKKQHQEERNRPSDEQRVEDPSSFDECKLDTMGSRITNDDDACVCSGGKESRGDRDETIINTQSLSYDSSSYGKTILRPVVDLKTQQITNEDVIRRGNANESETETCQETLQDNNHQCEPDQSVVKSIMTNEKEESVDHHFLGRAEIFITSIDKAIQTFMENARVVSFKEDSGDGSGQGFGTMVKFIATTLLDKLIGKRQWTSSFQDFHNAQNLNYLFLTVSLITVIPITRWLIMYILDLVLHLLLTILGTIAGVVAGAILAMNFYQKIYVDDHDRYMEDYEAEGSSRMMGRESMDFHTRKGSGDVSDRFTSPSNASNKKQMNATSQTHGQIHLPAHLHSSSDIYTSLMASAGYSVTTFKDDEKQESHQLNHKSVTHLRGQILRHVSISGENSFSFVKDPIERNSLYETPSITNYSSYKSKGMDMFQRMWPNLPEILQKEMGELMDFITRDYVLSWYHYIDDGVGYENEVEKRSRLNVQSNKGQNGVSISPENGANSTDQTSQRVGGNNGNDGKKSMVLSTTPARTIPFLEIFYSSLTTILGKLALSCENVNVPYLVLVKFLNIIKVNVRTYKDIRKIVIQKQKNNHKLKSPALTSSNGSIEIAMAREYLLQGKLHRAITFGLDVPGLLFGDSIGKECPLPPTHSSEGKNVNVLNEEDYLLEQRLFGNDRRVLHECELDYNRVLSHRLCRILFPRADFSSPVLRSVCIELLASMILNPIMGCFTPDYVNSWIKASSSDGSHGSENIYDSEAKECYNVDRRGIQSPSNVTSTSASGHLVEDFDLEELDMDEVVGGNESFETNAAEVTAIKNDDEMKGMDICDEILALLAMSLIELQAYIDFDEARDAKDNGEQLEIKWNDQGCIETVRNLVLVIEAMLMHGALTKRRKRKPFASPSGIQNVDENHAGKHDRHEYSSLTVMLMEITSNLESFETETRFMEELSYIEDEYDGDSAELHVITRPKASDLSTLRTLIAAWLHTGVVYRTLHVFLHSRDSILYPFYHKNAFIRKKENIDGFLQQLRVLHNVDIMVDTLTILTCPPLDLYLIEDQIPISGPSSLAFSGSNDGTSGKLGQNGAPSFHGLETLSPAKQLDNRRTGLGVGDTIKANFENNRKRFTRLVRPVDLRHTGSPSQRPAPSPKLGSIVMQTTHQSIPPYLAFHRNEALASSLRSERDDRRKSFLNIIKQSKGSKKIPFEMICRSNIQSQENFREHRDLHNLAKGFYSSTTVLSLQHSNYEMVRNISHDNKQSLIIMENISTRRKWAIPYDDSSFLTRSQPVQLDVVGIHRDERSHHLSYKKYAGYFDEPILNAKMNEFRGAKLRRKCFLRYYPSDRTAAINFIRSNNSLDSQLGRLIHLETSGASKQIKEFERYLCNKSFQEGSERSGSALTNTLLSSSIMESNDFSKIPRPGKISDFVYRFSLYEEPEVELSGNRFIVQDASCIGAHRADASSLEISDAALTTCLLLGQTHDRRSNAIYHVKCDDYGVPFIHLKLADHSVDTSSPLAMKNRRQYNDDLRPYRLSFVRAALLLSTSRSEAQMQVSAKSVDMSFIQYIMFHVSDTFQIY